MKSETLLLSEAYFLAFRLSLISALKIAPNFTAFYPAQDIGFITHAQRVHFQFSAKSAIN